jgi:1-acyl-sn-glycerol-3-phosphate acyltransferase
MLIQIQTLLWKVLFIILMLITLIMLPFVLITKLFLPRKAYRYIVYLVGSNWGRLTVLSTGSTVRVEGLDNIPKDKALCFIGNHQSFFDIPSLLGFIKRPMGFVAKMGLKKFPVLSYWMRQVPCVFLDQTNPRKAITSFQISAEIMKQGHPIVIFPEGKRSRSNTPGEYHLGSLRLPLMANATIVPFVIKNSYQVLEIDNHIHAAKIKIRILPPITPDKPLYHDKTKLLALLKDSIQTNLDDM